MTALLADPFCRLHDTGPGHPEQPARFDAALRGIGEWPLTAYEPRAATAEEIGLCHDLGYIQIARRDVEAGRSQLSTGDTDVCPRSFEVALRGVGTVLTAVDLVMAGGSQNAFCAVRPPGHHATADRGMEVLPFR